MLPAPYYTDGCVSIYHGDATDIVPLLEPPGLLLLDPPFDAWNAVPDIRAPAVVAFTTFQHRHHIHGRYGQPRTELVWHFSLPRWVSHNVPLVTHELILVYGDVGRIYVGDETYGPAGRSKGRSSIGRDNPAGERLYTPQPQKALTSVLAYPREPNGDAGIWTKPLALLTVLLQWAAPSSVLDPYMGSGSTLRAAKNLGIPAIGIERSERLCDAAARRAAQDTLFAPTTTRPAG